MIRPFVFVVPFALVGCLDLAGECETTIVGRVPDPSAAKQAVLFERSCGATTGFSTQISITRIGEDPQAGRNVFIADGGTAATKSGGPWAEVRWLARDHLLVRFDREARVHKAAPRLNGIQIRFEQASPPVG